MIEIGFAVWYLIGLYSFYYWWTKYEDITADTELIVVWLVMGFFGVLIWIIILTSIHEEAFKRKEPIVLFKKRKPNKTKG
tara:strand:- start:935 stop:1174 length:240 start_codon:yes stop_codon:yes gene_type:complete